MSHHVITTKATCGWQMKSGQCAQATLASTLAFRRRLGFCGQFETDDNKRRSG
jgi:hypothetical protein